MHVFSSVPYKEQEMLPHSQRLSCYDIANAALHD
jgi:hypothetical protein